MQKLKTEKLSGSLGARVIDFSLHNLTDEGFARVADALWEHQVLVFKKIGLRMGYVQRLAFE